MPGGRARRPHVVSALARFWADDRGLSVFSALLLVVAFVVPPFTPAGGGRTLAGDFVYALLLVSGVLALGKGKIVRMLLLPVALLTLAVDIGSWLAPVPKEWVLATSLVSLLLFLAVILGQTLRSGPITPHRLLGAAAAYVLLGVIFAYAYGLVWVLRPGSFSGAIGTADAPRAFLYFSFVTLTTTGYGDVLPVHPAARALANLEAVTGTLYIAITISRLVSLAVTAGREGRR